MPLPDIDALDTFGGEKTNFAPVEDATTDLDADHHNAAMTSVAAMTHTAFRTWVALTLAATTGSMVLDDHDSVWGDSVSVAPTIARSSTGVYTVTVPSSVTDELGNSHTVNLRGATVNVRSATYQRIQCKVTAANVITIYTFDSGGSAADSTSPVEVFAL